MILDYSSVFGHIIWYNKMKVSQSCASTLFLSNFHLWAGLEMFILNKIGNLTNQLMCSFWEPLRSIILRYNPLWNLFERSLKDLRTNYLNKQRQLCNNFCHHLEEAFQYYIFYCIFKENNQIWTDSFVSN